MADKPPKVGRPKINPERLPAFAVRWSADELEAFRSCADSAGLSLAAWMRLHLRAAAVRETGNRSLFSSRK